MAVSEFPQIEEFKPLDETMIVIKIFSPLGAMLAGNYEQIQEIVDKSLCDAYYNYNVTLLGYTNPNMYIRYANNSTGPDANMQETILIEYYCTDKDNTDTMRALKLIHQAILKQFGSSSLNITVKYMIFNNVAMTGLDADPQ